MDSLPRLRRVLGKVLGSRAFAAIVLALLSTGMITYISVHLRAVTVEEENGARVVLSLSEVPVQQPAAAFAAASQPEPEQKKDTFTVHVTADGVTTIVHMTGGSTVDDVLKQAGIELDQDDLTSKALTETIEEDTSIQVERVQYREYSKTESIPFKTEVKYTGTLPDGKSKVIQKGKKGSITRIYRDMIKDGQVVDTRLVSESRVEPVNAVKLVGTKPGVPMSKPPFDIPLDSAGQPLKYKKVITNKATAYTCDRGLLDSTTATGIKAQVGVVAVNPKLIPYGSRLYIVSPDGKFVYGYAIAGDTGASVRSNKTVVDLYMDTYEECIRFGRRVMNVYILE